MSGAELLQIVPLARAEITIEPWNWEFAVARRAQIDRYFADRQQRQPALWNGRVLLLKDYRVESGILRGSSFETDFASFMAWRAWNFPDRNVFNVFAMAAVRAADGGYLIGEMADHTASAGQLYFPSGTPDLEDVDAGMLNLDGHWFASEILSRSSRSLLRQRMRRRFGRASCAISHPLRSRNSPIFVLCASAATLRRKCLASS
jgi:hypothetical protein